MLPDSWSSEETSRAIAWRQNGIPIIEIAKRLGRTPRAVEAKLRRKSTTRPAPRPWTTEEEEMLLDLYEEGVPPRDIAEQLGRTAGAITNRLKIKTTEVFSSDDRELKYKPASWEYPTGMAEVYRLAVTLIWRGCTLIDPRQDSPWEWEAL